jgi:hypothetical protein
MEIRTNKTVYWKQLGGLATESVAPNEKGIGEEIFNEYEE